MGMRTAEFIFKTARDSGWRDPRRSRAFDDIDPDLGGDGPPKVYFADEDGVIRAFIDKHGNDFVFDHEAGAWFRFDGNVWRREKTKLVMHLIRGIASKFANLDVKAKGLKRVASWEAIERGARTAREVAFASDIWDRDQMLLATPEGVIDLRTGLLRPGAPADYISRSTVVAPIPLSEFDPAKHCPTWISFLNLALANDIGAIRIFQQWGGYSLTGLTKEQKFLFVYGPGGSGKGTAVNTIAEILGDYAINVSMETLTATKHEQHSTEIARLRGVRMARASETEKGKAWAENRIKTLTGQDKVTARFMRQDNFEFLPEFKLTLFGNNRPSLTDVDRAIKRRILILPFDHPPAEPDSDLPEKLKAEWPGILSWLILGCLDWLENGLVIPDVMRAATDAYFEAEDIFAQWIGDHCDVGLQYSDTTASLWESWKTYAYDVGVEPGNMKSTFAETLVQRGYIPAEKVGEKRLRGYKGIRVRPSEDDAEALI